MDVDQQQKQLFAAQNQTTSRDGQKPSSAQLWLHASYRSCIDALREPLQQAFMAFEQALFAQADSARLPAEQQDFLGSIKRFKLNRTNFDQRFIEGFNTSFLQMGVPADGPDASVEPDDDWITLELLDPAKQELAMSVEQIGARGETRHSSVLYELGYRLAVLIGAPPLEGEALPLGPRSLTRLFESAGRSLDVPLQHSLLLLQCFDRSVIQALGPTYHAINAQLQANGILPQLRSAPLPRHFTQRSSSIRSLVTAAPTSDVPATMDTAAVEGAPISSIEIMESLRDLLAQKRVESSHDHNADGRRIASAEELQSALDALQQHLTQVTGRASREIRGAQRLRQELLDQINLGKPECVEPLGLSGEQSDIVELVALLFEQMVKQLRRGGQGHSLLGGLQLPVLSMAVIDHDFFEQQEHPARKLLDAITAAARDWLDGSDDESSKSLACKLEQLVQRATGEPPSNVLYISLLADIEYHLSLLSRKSEAAERRHVEAAQGRERLHQARQRAEVLMAERFAQSPPRGLLRALLDRAWSDVLALTLLRHGEDSDTFKAQLLITDQFLGREPITDPTRLRRDVESGLQQIGMQAEESAQVAQRLIGNSTPEINDLGSSTHLALRLKKQHRLGEPHANSTAAISTAGAGGRPAPTTPAPDLRVMAIEKHLRQLPFGSWFEFGTAGQVHPLRRKLAWYSPMSGRCLMVSRRGQRGEEMNLNKLAHEIAHGRVRELPVAGENLFDRAWRSLTSRLNQEAFSVKTAGNP